MPIDRDRRLSICQSGFPWGSMDLVLPVGEDWDASGEKPKNDLVKFFFIFKNIILFFWGT
jgi:hypothetical protein